jgi:hypothetical protein
MTFDRHGHIGANLYVMILLLVVLAPGLRVLNASGLGYFIAVALMVLLGAWINSKAIIRYGGSTAGEVLGLMSGLVALITVFVSAKIWTMVDGNPDWVDLARLIAVAVVSLLSALMCRKVGVDSKVINK